MNARNGSYLPCTICGTLKYVRPSEAPAWKFCSRKCLGVSRSERMTGNTYRVGKAPGGSPFIRGHTPWNKGVKGSIPASATSFKKGLVPYNVLGIGATTVRIDKKGKHRNWIRTEQGWIPLAQHTWIQAYGAVPDGHVIHHIDFNSLNDALGNLIAVTRQHHPRIHNRYLIARAHKGRNS